MEESAKIALEHTRARSNQKTRGPQVLNHLHQARSSHARRASKNNEETDQTTQTPQSTRRKQHQPIYLDWTWCAGEDFRCSSIKARRQRNAQKKCVANARRRQFCSYNMSNGGYVILCPLFWSVLDRCGWNCFF